VRKSRHEPQIGDIFEVRRAGPEKLLGRVVSTTAVAGPTHGCNLVYVCRDASRPTRNDLLLPPLLTTRAPWARGYFEHVRSQPLLPGEYFERHCFRDMQGRFVDEEGRPLEAPFEPTGEAKIVEVEAIEEQIASALAVAPSPRPAPASSDFTYEIEPRPPSVEEYVRLCSAAGLSPRTTDAARAGLGSTWFGVTVRLDGEPVGMGRVVGDGGCFFQIVDVAVLPQHRRRGLGTRIMMALVAHLEAHAPAGASVTLFVDSKARRLCERFGFRETTPGTIGMAKPLRA
jgi:ribosomal protein S18 acetylase RimI-like enzyme